MKKVNRLTKAAMLTALSAICLCAGGWIPRGALALAAIASLFVAVSLIECGWLWAVGTYIASLLLGLLLCADKVLPLWFGFLLGPYPIFKHFIERLPKTMLRWMGKLLAFFVCAGVFYALFSAAFVSALPKLPWYVRIPALSIVFILYDIGFSRLMGLYLRRIHN